MNPGCAETSASLGEQLAGSAPRATAWVALEQDGPWGARALTDSHLDPGVGRALEDLAAAHDVRPALVRRPGAHADRGGPRRVLVAHTLPGHAWLLTGLLPAPEAVLDLDWAALAAGDAEAVRRSLPGSAAQDRSQLLVCTNGTRDRCCAVLGRPVAAGVHERHPGRVWEVTHTSGHRFAPTAVLLPAGTLHGRLDVDAAAALLTAAERGETVLAGSRGRSTWTPAGQVAELAVREATGLLDLGALTVAGEERVAEHAWRLAVAHTDGRTWLVEVRSEETGLARAESCGKGLAGMRRWVTRLG